MYSFYVNIISIEKQEAVNSLQKELADVQDHLNLAKRVSSVTNAIFQYCPEGMQTTGSNNKQIK